MSEISDMIQRLCPDGVEYRKLGEVVNCLSLSARRRGLATLCVPFPSSSPEGPLQESLSFHAYFHQKGRSGPYVSKMTTFCIYLAAGLVV